jgi:hypothetical protein
MTTSKDIKAESGSANTWLYTNKLAQFTELVSLGATKVVLSWSVEDKTITLVEINENNAANNTIFQASFTEVSRSGFFRNSITLTINGKNYALALRDTRVNTKATNDTVQVVDTTGLFHSYVDVYSDIHKLKAALEEDSTTKVYSSPISSKMYVKIVVVAIIIGFIVMVAISFISFAAGWVNR